MESTVLSPGDFLCIPAGAWHCAEALEDSLSLNLALDHEEASQGDCILAHLKARIDETAENRAPMLSLDGEPWSDADVVTRTQAIVDELAAELQRLKSEPETLERVLKDWFQRARK